MNKIVKKSIAILTCLTFVMIAVTSSSAVNVRQQEEENEEIVEDAIFSTETVTIYRYGPDGSVTPIERSITLEEGQDIGDALIAQCDELLENDKEIQKLLNDDEPNIMTGLFVRVQSKGSGFHYKTLLLEKLYLRYFLWKLVLPRAATILAKPLVLCIYKKDFNAKTIIKPIRLKASEEKEINSTHLVIVNSFIGYTTWVGRFAYAPLTIIPRAFSGYGRFVFTKRIT